MIFFYCRSCDENMGVCSFPSAHVQLTKSSQVLMSSQPYRIKLLLEVPESQINKDIGINKPNKKTYKYIRKLQTKSKLPKLNPK